MSTPTIDTLTAEIRVLTIGGRQLTKSMYRQLDVTYSDEFEPFGRVKSGDKVYASCIELVGRDRDGILVRSSCEHPSCEVTSGPPEWGHWLGHQTSDDWERTSIKARFPYVRIRSLHGFAVRGDGTTSTSVAWNDLPAHCPDGDRPTGYGQCPCDVANLEAVWQSAADREQQEAAEWVTEWKRLRALPLIVLGG